MKKLLLAAASLGMAVPVAAQTVAITGGKVVIGDGSAPIDDGVVVIDRGKIVAAGTAGRVNVPAWAQRIDARGKWVTPGLVSGFSQIGLAEVDLSAEGSDDTSASRSPHSAAIDVTWSVNPKAAPIAVSRADGITRAIVAPTASKSIFAGRGAMIDTGDDYDPVTRARAFQLIEFGERGSALAGGTRSAAYLALVDALNEAQGRRRTGDRPDESLLTDADVDALRPVVRGQEPLVIKVERAVDIVNILRLKRDFPRLRMILMGVSEGWQVADRIAAAGVPVIAEPVTNRPTSFEKLAATQSNVGRMRAAGVNVAVANLSDFLTRNAFAQRQYAGNLVALTRVPGHTGVGWDEAFAMITSRPAAILGMADEVGSLRAGRRGDVVIWSGDPLEPASAAEAVWIDGVRQPLETRQSRLAERYKDLDRDTLPEAYRK